MMPPIFPTAAASAAVRAVLGTAPVRFFPFGAASGFSMSNAMPWPPPMQAEAMP